MQLIFKRFWSAPIGFAIMFSAQSAMAETFKYYVWTDEQGVVHADQEPPKGKNYQVRVIEDINANVVPKEDFRPFGEIPPQESTESASASDDSAISESDSESSPTVENE